MVNVVRSNKYPRPVPQHIPPPCLPGVCVLASSLALRICVVKSLEKGDSLALSLREVANAKEELCAVIRILTERVSGYPPLI